jgi:hypothetical protein
MNNYGLKGEFIPKAGTALDYVVRRKNHILGSYYSRIVIKGLESYWCMFGG